MKHMIIINIADKSFLVAKEMLAEESDFFGALISENWGQSVTVMQLEPQVFDLQMKKTDNGCTELNMPDLDSTNFSLFLECLYLLRNKAFLMGVEKSQKLALANPNLIRGVLKLSHYFQTTRLTEAIIDSVKYFIETEKSKDDLQKYLPLISAVEVSLPEEEIPHWNISILRAVHNSLFPIRRNFKEGSSSHMNSGILPLLKELTRRTLSEMIILNQDWDLGLERVL